MVVHYLKGGKEDMTEKPFKLDDFDSEVEMWELLNTQREVIIDLNSQNEDLRLEVQQLQHRNQVLEFFRKNMQDTLRRHYKECKHYYVKGTVETTLESIAGELGIDLDE